ncbi:MAG: hypothetical protein KH354_03510 [Clostridiales bacterium]|nr:hypothetical protein [Clostridiales bacterium]
MAKKRMKGLKLFRFWPEIENSTTGYNTGAQVMFPWAMEISESPDSKDESIYADDTLYDEEYSELGCRYTVRFAEMTAEIKAALKGYILESDGTLKVSRNPAGPSIGFGYARLMADGEYRMFKHFGAKVLRVTDIPGTTKGNGSSSDAEVEFYCRGRELDDQFYYQKESVGKDTSWLDDTTGQGALGRLTVYAEQGSAEGKTKLIVAQSPLASANTFVYKTGTTVTMPAYEEALTTGWTALPANGEITATAGNAVVVAEVNAAKKALRAGSTVADVKPSV